jgi:hypothetical protein
MMEVLMARAERIARAAQLERLEQIAISMRERGVAVDQEQESVTVRGRKLAQRWLGDPLLRFAGRYGL